MRQLFFTKEIYFAMSNRRLGVEQCKVRSTATLCRRYSWKFIEKVAIRKSFNREH